MTEGTYILMRLHPVALVPIAQSGWPIRTYTTKDRAHEDLRLITDADQDHLYAVVEVPHIDA